MAIIPLEPTIFPEELFDGSHAGPSGRCWWGIYTKSRQEKCLARELLRYQIPFYLPLVGKETLVRHKPVRSHLPLFPGYLFLFGSDDERVRTLTTNRVSRILPVDDQDQLFSDLRQLHELVVSGAPLTIEQRLGPGQRVRIKSGAMQGLEGTILARRNGCRLLVAVNFLQQGVSVAIEDFMLELLE